jgi:hypothetical protein
MNKERRKEHRFFLLSEECGWSYVGSKTKTPNSIIDISSNGTFIESKLLPKANEVLEIVFLLPGNLGTLDVQGVVVWRRWAKKKKSSLPLGFAVKLIHNENTLKVMKAYVTFLRNKQIMKVSQRIQEEFFNGNGKGPNFI